MQLSEKITILRQKSLYSQEDFAKEIGVATSTVNRWEKGKAKPNITAMKAIRAFCEKHDYPYSNIEKEWISYSEEDKE